MKYWNAINIPGKTNVEDAQTSAPSTGNVLAAGNVESMKEAIEAAAQKEVVIGVDMSNSFVESEKVNELSDEYKKMFNQAFSKGDVSVEPVEGTDGYSVSVAVPENASGLVIAENPVPITSDAAYVRTPEEADAAKYMTADEVDPSKYDLSSDYDGNFDVNEGSEKVDEILTNTTENEPSESVSDNGSSIDKNALLSSIFSNGRVAAFADTIAEKVVEKVVEVPEPEVIEPEYSLDDEKLADVIKTIKDYQAKYFEEIPAIHFSNRFLRNITKDVYSAHQDAVIKYEDPDLMDPLFLLYPLTTEDPYMAMGKFWDIVMTKIMDDQSWSDAISRSVTGYEEYIHSLEDDEDEEDDDVESATE